MNKGRSQQRTRDKKDTCGSARHQTPQLGSLWLCPRSPSSPAVSRAMIHFHRLRVEVRMPSARSERIVAPCGSVLERFSVQFAIHGGRGALRYKRLFARRQYAETRWNYEKYALIRIITISDTLCIQLTYYLVYARALCAARWLLEAVDLEIRGDPSAVGRPTSSTAWSVRLLAPPLRHPPRSQ